MVITHFDELLEVHELLKFTIEEYLFLLARFAGDDFRAFLAGTHIITF